MLLTVPGTAINRLIIHVHNTCNYMSLHAGLEVISLLCVGAERYHSEYAVTVAVRVVSGGIPASVTEVELD